MRLQYSYLWLMLIILLFYNCNEEKDVSPPNIELKKGDGYIYSDTTIAFGKTIKVGIQLTKTDYNLTNFIIKQNPGTDFITVFDTGMNTPSIEIDYFITKGEAETDIYRFIIRDIEGNQAQLELQLNKDSINAFEPVKDLQAIVLDAQHHSPQSSFYDLSNERAYTMQQAFNNQETTDLFYYYYGDDENVIASPGANIEADVFTGATYQLDNWTTRNTTRFKVAGISTSEFDQISNDSLLIVTYGSTEGKRKSKNLQANDIYAFKTQNAKFGMFKVIEVVDADSGYIKIDIKVQK